MNKRWLYPLVLACVGCAEKGVSPAAPAGAAPAGKVAAAAPAETGKPAGSAPATTLVVKAVKTDTISTAVEVADSDLSSPIAKAHPDRAKAMLAAAAKTLEATKATYEMGTNTLANLHHWSRQLVLAERALAETKEEDQAALLDYWKRSKLTYLKVRALYNTGSRGGEAENFSAAAYYLAESELWIEAAGGTVPENID